MANKLMTDIDVADYSVSIKPLPGAMDPSQYTKFLSENIVKYDSAQIETAIDLGCGSGALAILLAKMGVDQIYAFDINPSAIKATKLNAELNNVRSKIEIIQADISTQLGFSSSVDLIVSNPPSLPMPEEPRSEYDMYNYYSGRNGRKFIKKLISLSSTQLSAEGILVFINTSLADVGETFKQLPEENFMSFSVNCKQIEFQDQYYEYIDWFEKLKKGGVSEYSLIDETHYETLYCIHSSTS